eukprot:CAMPEP_0205903294 /NCGR_PEP_ID=MMETSP1325-20131115/1_1 /ASSEMBLY_ACC=CAM_ASM_000708 /TAXON_ID=236786 /ORGANISM="Florenciella sp., Strain RCC1007" /LENGTH=185 /DNA_ID=CAMNT_0053268925 /DNA_START=26 /DNA_END=583 /DNA_ORIENTATION=+
MNASFRGALEHYLVPRREVTHSQAVCGLYRKCLKTLGSWCVDREVFNEEATRVQQLFRANANLSEGQGAVLLKDGVEELAKYTHPDKYIHAYLPGGSLYMRNPPLPLSVCYPDGIPEGVTPPTIVNADMSPVRPGEKADSGRVLVDASAKTMYPEHGFWHDEPVIIKKAEEIAPPKKGAIREPVP